jgi:hypothetical protein
VITWPDDSVEYEAVGSEVYVKVCGGGVRTMTLVLSEVDCTVVKVGYGVDRPIFVTMVEPGIILTKVEVAFCPIAEEAETTGAPELVELS